MASSGHLSLIQVNLFASEMLTNAVRGFPNLVQQRLGPGLQSFGQLVQYVGDFVLKRDRLRSALCARGPVPCGRPVRALGCRVDGVELERIAQLPVPEQRRSSDALPFWASSSKDSAISEGCSSMIPVVVSLMMVCPYVWFLPLGLVALRIRRIFHLGNP